MSAKGKGGKQILRPTDVPVLRVSGRVVAPPGVKAGPFVFAPGRNGSDFVDGLAREARVGPELPYAGELPVTLETKYIYRNLSKVFDDGGSHISNAVRVNQWIPTYHGLHDAGDRERPKDPRASIHFEHWRETVDPMLKVRDLFITAKRPASVAVPIDRLLTLPAHCEIDMISITNDSGWTKEEISTSKVPVPKGGYAQAIVAGPWIFLAGFVATDFKTGIDPAAQPPSWVWYGDKLALETDFTLKHQRIVLEEAGFTWKDVVKCQIWLDAPAVRHFPAFEQVWKQYFPTDPPARTISTTNGIGLKDGWIEIDVIGIRPEFNIKKEAIQTHKAAPALGHAPQAIKAGPMLFLSTGLPLDTAGRPVGTRNCELPFSGEAIRIQIEQILQNAAAICEAAGGDIHSLVQSQVFFEDLRDFPAAMGPWLNAFGEAPPAATFVEVPPVSLVPEARISMDLWAYVD